MKIQTGEKYQIQCYKHNRKIRRAWDEAVVLAQQKDYIVCGNDRTLVTESEGSTWKTKEPAIMYYFKDKWFNIIAQLKKDGIYFYCNIATPYIIEENTIKYIDYDLDLRIFPSGDYKVLDRLEYKYHKKKMKYSADLDFVINESLKELIKKYKSKDEVFSEKKIREYYEKYKKIKAKKE